MKNDEYSNSQSIQESVTFLQSTHQPATEELYKILHELRIYQVELETQNKGLRETHEQLEESRTMYAELYDSAPIGYVTLTNTGSIYQSNLTAAQMLRYDRSRLIGQPFVVFVEKSNIDLFFYHLRQCARNKKASTKLSIVVAEQKKYVQLLSVPVQKQETLLPCYHTVILDSTTFEQEETVQQLVSGERKLIKNNLSTDREYNLLESETAWIRVEQLEQQLETKTSELSQMTLSLVEKFEWLSSLEKKLKSALWASPSKSKKIIQQALHDLNNKVLAQDQWVIFEQQLGKMHRQFLRFMAVTYPSLTPAELKICCLLRLNLSTKEIARLLHTSSKTIENQRYRIRKKMKLSSRKNLTAFLLACD